MILRDRIDEIIKRRPGTTQADFVRLTGRSRTAVSFWFNGQTQTIPLETAMKLADYAGLEAEWIAFGDGPMEPLKQQDKFKNCNAQTRAVIDYLLEHPEVADGVWAMLAAVSKTQPISGAKKTSITSSVDDLRDHDFATTKKNHENQGSKTAGRGKTRP